MNAATGVGGSVDTPPVGKYSICWVAAVSMLERLAAEDEPEDRRDQLELRR